MFLSKFEHDSRFISRLLVQFLKLSSECINTRQELLQMNVLRPVNVASVPQAVTGGGASPVSHCTAVFCLSVGSEIMQLNI